MTYDAGRRTPDVMGTDYRYLLVNHEDTQLEVTRLYRSLYRSL